MKKDDPAIEQIRSVRHRISAEFGHDPQKVIAYYANAEKELLRDGQVLLAEDQGSKRVRSDS